MTGFLSRTYFGAVGRVAVLLGFALSSCSLKLEPSPEARITCTSNASCPSNFECVLGECAPRNGNLAPTVTVAAVSSTSTSVTIPVVVYDAESDSVSLSVELQRDGTLTALPIAVEVASSPDGSSTELTWETSGFFTTDARETGLALRITPRDRFRAGQSVLSPEFAFGNNRPQLTALYVGGGGTVSGVTSIGFRALDDDDLLAITQARVTQAGQSFTIDLNNPASFPATSLTDIVATSAGAQVTLAWDSSLLPLRANEPTTFEIVATDSFGAESLVAISPSFVVNNAPSVGLSLQATRGIDSISVGYTVAVATGRTAEVAFSYRVGGGPWVDAPHSTSNAQTFVWNALGSGLPTTPRDRDGDGVPNGGEAVLTFTSPVELRAIATDDSGLAGVESVTPVFSVGDTPPVLVLDAISGPQRNEVPIAFSLSDAEADAAQVQLEFCLHTDPCTPEAAPTSAGWRTMRVGFGSLADLASGVSVPHVVTWRSVAPLLDGTPELEQGIGDRLLENVKVRGRASNTIGGVTVFGAWSAPTTLEQVRNQSPPRLVDVQVRRLAVQGGASPVTVLYTVIDEEADPIDFTCEYSNDGGPFSACAEHPSARSEGRYDLESAPPALGGGGGVQHTFVWDPTGQMVPVGSTRLRLTAHDARGSTSQTIFLEQPAAVKIVGETLYGNPRDEVTTFPGTYNYGPNEQEATLAGFTVADFNHDGLPDVAAAYGPPPLPFTQNAPAITLFYGLGSDGVVGVNRQLGNAASVVLAENPVAIDHGDVNGDGADDVVLVGASSLVWAAASLVPTSLATSGTSVALTVAKLNADAFADAVVAQHSPPAVRVHAGGASGFAAGISTALSSAPVRLVSGDFDADLLTDVAVLSESGDVFTLKGLGGGVLDVPVLAVNVGSANKLDSADVDGDGTSDLIVGGIDGVSLLRSLGGGDFQVASISTDNVGSIRLSDFNGDGAPDLFMARPPPPGPIPDGSVPQPGSATYPLARVHLNDGGGGFAASTEVVEFSREARTHITDARAVDFGGDLGPEFFYSAFRVAGGAGRYQLIARLTGGYTAGYSQNQSPTYDTTAFDAERFAKGTTYGAGAAYSNLSIAIDVDRDGRLDVVTARGDRFFEPTVHASSLALFRASGNTGKGEPTLSLTATHPLAGYTKAMARGDFNRDLVDDLVVVGGMGVQVLFGTGALGFTNGPSLTSADPYMPVAVVVADFDQDGDDDVAVARTYSTLSVWLNNGSGVFAAQPDVATGTHSQTYLGQNLLNYEARGLAACDVDNDGKLDLVVSNHHDVSTSKRGSISIRYGDGSGGFSSIGAGGGPGELLLVPNAGPYFHHYDLLCADFDRDGSNDLVTTGIVGFDDSTFPWPTIGMIVFGAGDGTFGGQSELPGLPSDLGGAAQILHRVVAGDLDNDGLLDVAVAGTRGGITLLRGTGDRGAPFSSISAPFSHDGPRERPHLLLTDLDDDELLDLVVTSTTRYDGDTKEKLTWYAPRFDSREPWRRAVSGLASPAVLDRAGRPKQKPTLAFHRAAVGPRGEPDPSNSLRRNLSALTAGLVPLTDMWRASGDVHFVREGSRLAVAARFAPTTISVPITKTLSNSDIEGGTLHAFVGRVDWRRADEQASDPLFGQSLAHRFLPAPELVLPEVTWAPAASVLKTDPSPGRRVEVTTNTLGFVQVFVSLP